MKPVVIISGVASSVGSACAQVFADAGYAVGGIDPALTESARRLAAISGGTTIERDLRSQDVAQETVDWLVTSLGSLDALVICNGLLKDVDEALNSNLKTAFHAVAAATRHVKERRSGKIVAIVPNDGRISPHEYAVRSAVIGLTRAAARELGYYNVNVNAVAPELYMVEAADVARVAYFLCTEEARHITGEVLYLNAGMQL